MRELWLQMELSSFKLKVIGMVTMIIDHVGMVFFPEQVMFRIIGRIAFPIFCFLLVEGFFHSKDIFKYMRRIFLMAIISEVPFDLLLYGRIFDYTSQNVFFTLFLGLLVLYLLESLPGNFAKVSSVILILLVSEALRTDYSSSGILMILCFYVYHDRIAIRNVAAAFVNVLVMGAIQSFAVVALIPISLYRGNQGRKKQRLFYLIYPVSLLILLALRIWL